MPRGPAPSKNKRRRNAPTIPTTTLPASGRKGRPPSPPAAYQLQKAGKDWWKWAWSLPQAKAWDDGARYTLARRASLEDDLVAIDHAEFVVDDYLGDDDEKARELRWLVGRLKAMATGRASVMKEMRELDNRLGLNPKAMLDLRWEIVDDSAEDETPKPAAKSKAKKSPADERRARLSLVKSA